MTVSEADKQRITSYVEAHRDELAAFLSELVQMRSVFPPGEYAEIAARMDEAFAATGARTTQIVAPKDRVEEAGLTYPRPNVVASLGSGASPVLLIGTHMDVVEEGDAAEWTHEPFAGLIEDGRVWGRGACDAKCTLAAQVFAARALVDAGVTLSGTLLLIASVDDEGRFDRLKWPGMTFLAESGLAEAGYPQPDMAINGEASGLAHICGSFKGRLILEIPVIGETAHAATSFGVNAIDKALVLVARLRQIPLEEHPLQGSETLNICAIEGRADRYGDIPPICRVGVEIRAVPPHGTGRIRAAIDRVLSDLHDEDPDFKVGELTYFSDRAPVETPADHPLIGALVDAAAYVGVNARYDAILGTGELQAFVSQGIAGVTYGPGSIGLVHRSNEYLDIDELVHQTQIYALAALELCG